MYLKTLWTITLLGLFLAHPTLSEDVAEGEAKLPPPTGEEKPEGGDPAEIQEGGDEPEKKRGSKCNQKLLQTYGMVGFSHAKEMTLDMCGAIKNSCCQEKDQLKIYESWVEELEESNLKERHNRHFSVYSELLVELEMALTVASKIKTAKEGKGVSNCFLVARDTLKYKINEVGPKLKEALRAMYAFFYDTYKGVYCTICDGDSQKFFNVEEKKVVLSGQFCRKVVSSSLHMLLYYHIHLKNMVNLVSIMLTSCDAEGKFGPATTVPVALNFVIDEKDKRQLYDCLKKREDPKWLAYCGRICNEFHLTQFVDFFQPKLDKFEELTLYLRKKLVRFVPFEDKIEQAEKSKEETQKKTEEKKKEKEKPKEEPKRRILEHRKFSRDSRKLDDEQKQPPAADTKGKEKEGEKGEEGEGEEGDDKVKEKEKDTGEPKVDPSEDTPEPTLNLRVKSESINIIRQSINGGVPLEKFESYVEDEGINLFEHGSRAEINLQTFETVQKLVALQATKSADGKTVDGKAAEGKPGDAKPADAQPAEPTVGDKAP